MKKSNYIKITGIAVLLFTAACLQAQDSVVKQPVLKLNYYSVDNTIPYLLVQTQFKEGKKITPAENISGQLFMDGDSSEANLVGKFTTGKDGKAKMILPAGAQAIWNSSPQHSFKATAEGKNFEASDAEINITKSKITIDTATDEETKSITVTVTEYKDGEWKPAPDVELKIGIRRLNSLLPAGEEESYTTDSSGQVTAEFNKDSLPGDSKGNIILAVQVDENDLYGNLSAEKIVPWGIYKKYESNFDKRSLWARQFKSPVWLLVMAYTIIGAVWGTLIYLLFQLVKIVKLGKAKA